MLEKDTNYVELIEVNCHSLTFPWSVSIWISYIIVISGNTYDIKHNLANLLTNINLNPNII